MNVIQNIEKTMSSKQIADVVDSRHDSVKRTIERLVEKAIISQPPLVGGEKSANGVIEKLYMVNERDSYVVVAQLCPEFTAKLVDYWQETKNKYQTGSLDQRQEQALRLTKWAVEAAKAYGFEGNQAFLSADKAVKQITGVSSLGLLQIELKNEHQTLNLTPTEIGKQLNPKLSAVAVNKLLESLNYQEKLGSAWVPTPKGKPYAIFLDTGKKHSDGTPITQLKWLSTIIPHLS